MVAAAIARAIIKLAVATHSPATRAGVLCVDLSLALTMILEWDLARGRVRDLLPVLDPTWKVLRDFVCVPIY